MSRSWFRIAAMILTLIVCVGLGAAAAIAVMEWNGYELKKWWGPPSAEALARWAKFQKDNELRKQDVIQRLGKFALARLVAKLDRLTSQPIELNLSKQQQGEILKQLEGLAKQETLTEEEAQARLEALHKILAANKEVLEAAGYSWSGMPVRVAADANVQNPFLDAENRRHLQALQKALAK